MSTRIVVDVGNTRVKFGVCSESAVVESVSYPADAESWDTVVASWLKDDVDLVVTGVVPSVIRAVNLWAKERGAKCRSIESHRELDLNLDVEKPDQVGIDRLLGALAAKHLFPNQSLLVIDAGSAITINWLDASGTFRGGAILPGLGLMASALHYRTAKLPEISIDKSTDFPGGDTESAIRCGILSAACGAIERTATTVKPDIFVFTGGDGEIIYNASNVSNKHLIPRLVLEGIRIAAEMRR